MSEAQVLIAGAGPTGLALAAELLRRGIAVQIVDAADGPAPHSRALAMHARTLEALEPLEIGERLIAAGTPIERVRLHRGPEPLATLPLAEIPSRYPFVLAIPQSASEGVLIERLEELGGRVEWGREVLDVDRGERSVNTMLRTATGEEQLEAPWLVGCDGARSAVRGALGLEFAGESLDESFLLADVELDGLDRSSFRGHLGVEGPLVLIPLPKGWRLIATVEAAQATHEAAADAAHWQTLLRERGGIETPIGAIRWSSRFRVHSRRVTRMRVGRVCLAGDAAHIHSPVGGQGMNLGLHDAVTLAAVLAPVVRGEAPARTLEPWQATRLGAAARVLANTAFATRMVTSRSALVRAAVDLALRAGPRIPPIRRRILREIAMLDSPL